MKLDRKEAQNENDVSVYKDHQNLIPFSCLCLQKNLHLGPYLRCVTATEAVDEEEVTADSIDTTWSPLCSR